MCFSKALLTMSFLRRRRRRFRDFSCMPWFPPPLERRTRPEPVTLNRFDAALLVFILGIWSLVLPLWVGRLLGFAAVCALRMRGDGVMVDGGFFVKATESDGIG